MDESVLYLGKSVGLDEPNTSKTSPVSSDIGWLPGPIQ